MKNLQVVTELLIISVTGGVNEGCEVLVCLLKGFFHCQLQTDSALIASLLSPLSLYSEESQTGRWCQIHIDVFHQT